MKGKTERDTEDEEQKQKETEIMGAGKKLGTEEQRNRRTEEQKNRGTEKQRNRETEEQRNRETEEQRDRRSMEIQFWRQSGHLQESFKIPLIINFWPKHGEMEFITHIKHLQS